MTDPIARLRAILAAATPADRWEHRLQFLHGRWVFATGPHHEFKPSENEKAEEWACKAANHDAEFLSTFRNIAEPLLAVAEAASKLNSELTSPSPCHVMRRQYAARLGDSLSALRVACEAAGLK